MEIDGYNVNAKYDGAGERDLPDFPDIKWYSEHVRESQYLLQIVKCRNTECCRPRSGLFRLLDNIFLPPPVKVKQTDGDLALDEGGQFLNLPVNLALCLSASLKDFLQMTDGPPMLMRTTPVFGFAAAVEAFLNSRSLFPTQSNDVRIP
ncbi:unnamed protein product [Acanthoscelides obtectus]|uniref:Uncharacterized protein n=1 Tax=Acanthoscelides obtectus TaxID=200917 RepID=A0A9P0M1C5_ACAOB|nr:unnamed protein product [Acanthoscelides obtectus]CAK1670349.1 hypothetical protein AOBTE_LOCUS27573 [Acanthoscelides obtectus]